MRTFQIEIPENEYSEQDIKMLLAGMLYERGIISMGKASEMAGVTKRFFIEELGKYGFSIFNYSVEELNSDIENAGGSN